MAQILHCYGCGLFKPAATAPIQPLAWELLYAIGAALKKEKKESKKKAKIIIVLLIFYLDDLPLMSVGCVKIPYYYCVIVNFSLKSVRICFIHLGTAG